MKKIALFILIAFTLLFINCRLDTASSFQSVQTKYPDSEIVLLPNTISTFIVRTPNGDIHWIRINRVVPTKIEGDIILLKGETK